MYPPSFCEIEIVVIYAKNFIIILQNVNKQAVKIEKEQRWGMSEGKAVFWGLVKVCCL
jgi:hypothetical protein